MPDSTQRTQLLHAASLVPIGAFAGKPAMPLTRPVLLIGSGPHARFLLKSDTVSTNHTLLVHTKAGWYFRDLVSRTHTILNGKSLRESSIDNGDTLTIGKFVFHCVIENPPEPVAPPAPAALEITDAEIPVPIDTRTVLIGRRVGCEIRLIEESVSLVHAVLFEVDGVHYVRDLYSRTGTTLNGKKVHEERLKFGDIIVVGETTIRYVPDLTAGDQPAAAPADLVELEPFGVEEPRASIPRLDSGSGLEASLGGSVGGSLSGSLGGSAAGGSVAGDSLAGKSAAVESAVGDSAVGVRVIDPASLIPLADKPPASSVASAAGVALAEVPPAEKEIERPTISTRAALATSPVSAPADEEPVTLDFADEHDDLERVEDVRPVDISVERERAAEPIDLVAADEVADEDALADSIVLPLNSRDMIDGHGPADTIATEETETEPVAPVATVAAKAESPRVELPPVDAARPADIESPAVEAPEITIPDAAKIEADDIEADVLGLAPPAVEPPTPIEEEHRPLATLDLEDIEPETKPEARAIPPEPFAIAPLPPSAAPLAAADIAHHEPTLVGPIFADPVHDEVKAADVLPIAAETAAPANDHDDHDAPLEPPGIEPSAVPQSAEARRLSELQARIKAALEDPSTLTHQPLLPETPGAPAPKLSEAARRARTIAELLESNEEYEEAAERESEAIALPVADAGAASPAPLTLDEADAAQERSDEAGYDVPANLAAELPPLTPITEPPAPAIDIENETRTEDGPALTANVVEATGPAAIAELMRDAAGGTPKATLDVGGDVGELSLAAGESAIIGDEDDLVATSPAIEDVSSSAQEPRSDADEDTLVAESGSVAEAKPQAAEVIVADEIAPTISKESPIGEAAPDAIVEVPEVEVPATSPKGRRGRKLPAVPQEPTAAKPRKATPARKPPRGKKGAAVEAETPTAEAPAIDPTLAAAAALASEAQVALDPVATSLASNVEAATDDVVQATPSLDANIEQAPSIVAPDATDETGPSTGLLASIAGIDAVQSRSEDLDTFADRVAEAGRESLEADVATADPDASFVEPVALAPVEELPTSIGSGDDHTAGATLVADAQIDPSHDAFATSAPIDRDADRSDERIATQVVEVDTGVDVAPLAASLDIVGTDSLDAIAGAAQPDTLAIDEVIVPSRLAAEPDELETVIEDDRAPVEADALHAGEAIMTSPVELDELDVELVAPMIDPDPGAIAEREAFDTKAEATGIIEDDLGGEHVVVVDEEEDDTLATAEMPIRSPRGELADTDFDALEDEVLGLTSAPATEVAAEEVATDLAFTDHSAAADAVAPALEVGNAAELAGEHVADTVGLDVEAIAEQGIESAAESPVEFVSLATSDEEPLPEALAISSETEFDAQAPTPSVEGAWLAPADAAVADALADAVTDTVSESASEPVADNRSDTSALELVGPADVAEAAFETEPAPLAGSTLSTGETLSLEHDSVQAIDETTPDVLGRIGPAQIEEHLADDLAAAKAEAEAPKPVAPRSLTMRGATPPTSIVNVNVPSIEELESTFHDAFAEALAMAEKAENRQPPPKPVAAPSARPSAPKWELDESLLEQAEANAVRYAAERAARLANPQPPAAPQQPPAAPAVGGAAAFMSLGGVGWIGDESTDEFEQVPASQRPGVSPSNMPGGVRPMLGGGVGQIGGAMAAKRGSRRRRPVANELEAAVADAAQTAKPQANDASPVVEAALPEIGADITSAEVSIEAPDKSSRDLSPLSDAIADAESLETAPATLEIDELSDLDEAAPSPVELSSLDLVDEASVADESALNFVPSNPPEPSPETARVPRPASPLTMPPRPVRRPPSRAGVDDSLASAAALSPFAEQALPLVDAFSQGGVAQPALDDVLAKFGGADGRIKGNPPITQDRPSNNNNGVAAPTPSPFASQAPIDDEVDDGSPLPIGHSSVRRTRHTINKLPLLLALMVGLMALAALAAWNVPVPVKVHGELAFTNLDKLNSLDLAAMQDRIRHKLDDLNTSARNVMDDRYGYGFLDKKELYAPIAKSARFEPSMPGTLVVEYTSSINQVDGDLARMNALMKALAQANQDLVDAQHKLQDAVQTYDRSITRDRERRASLQLENERVKAIAESGPEVRDVRRAETDADQAEQARKAAAEALDACEAELKRLESNPLAFVPASLIQNDVTPMLAMYADATDAAVVPSTQPAAAVPPDPQAELDKLTTQLQSTKARLDQVEAAQSPETKAARDGFDAAMDAFAGDVETARKQMGDRPELLQYVDSARKLQDQIRTMTETMVRRQQQQLTRLGELKQRLADMSGSTREQRVGGDPDLKTWNDQIAINERRLNGAKSDSASADDIAKIEAEISLLKNMVSGREEQLKDPNAQAVDKQLADMIAATQRDMEADRSANDKMLADMSDAFNKQQPTVENLPQEQKKLGESLAGRLAQIDLARQRYTQSLGQVVGGEALQVTELRQKVRDLESSIAKVKPLADAGAVAQAAEMERRAAAAKLLDDARTKVLAARAARDSAVAASEAKSKALAALVERRDAASAARQRGDAIKTEDEAIKTRMSQMIADRETSQIRLQAAVVPDVARGPNVRTIDAPHGDPRLMYGVGGLAMIGLLFTPLLVREGRHRPAPPQPLKRPATPHRGGVVPGNAHAA